MSHDRPVSAVNPLPPVVAALFLLVMGIEIAFYLGARGMVGGPGAVGWRLAAMCRLMSTRPFETSAGRPSTTT